MNRLFSILLSGALLFQLSASLQAGNRNKPDADTGLTIRNEGEAVTPAEETTDQENQETKAPDVAVSKTEKTEKSKSTAFDEADAFVAGPDWEFDGFVAGAQHQAVRSMFYINDLIYLNIGTAQGIAVGDHFGIYRRGEKIKDPHSGKFMGFEVRKVAVAKVTKRVEAQNCVARISKTMEDVQLGDLVRRGD